MTVLKFSRWLSKRISACSSICPLTLSAIDVDLACGWYAGPATCKRNHERNFGVERACKRRMAFISHLVFHSLRLLAKAFGVQRSGKRGLSPMRDRHLRCHVFKDEKE